MTSSTESFNLLKHTPMYKNEQNEREILQWRLLRRVQVSKYKLRITLASLLMACMSELAISYLRKLTYLTLGLI